MKKILSFLMCIILLTACSSQPANNLHADGAASVTVCGPENEIIFTADTELNDEMTALDILLDVAEEKDIDVVYSGDKSNAYITSIGSIKEKSSGGWIYTVNGESIMKPAGKCILKPDDHVEWKYIEF